MTARLKTDEQLASVVRMKLFERDLRDKRTATSPPVKDLTTHLHEADRALMLTAADTIDVRGSYSGNEIIEVCRELARNAGACGLDYCGRHYTYPELWIVVE